MFRLHTAQRPFLLPTGHTDGGEVVHDGDLKVPLLRLMESESTMFSLIMRSVPFVCQTFGFTLIINVVVILPSYYFVRIYQVLKINACLSRKCDIPHPNFCFIFQEYTR